MAGNQEQKSTAADGVELFAAVSGLAAVLASDLDLAPLDENENGVDHATRLLGEIHVRAEGLVAERDALKRSIGAHKGLTTRERNRAEALEAQLPAKPRRFDPIETPLAPAELLSLIEDAETVELAFVGPRGVEIKGLAPRSIGGDEAAWRQTGGRLRLQVPSLLVYGPVPGQSPHVVHGYALLIDGEVAAVAPRGEPLAIGGGLKFELKDDVAF